MHNEHIQALESSIGLERTLARAVRSVELRMIRREQSQNPGGLLAFIRYFWHIIEPGTVMREGWALEAICAHLEAVDRGEVRKLLITVPPGAMKSLTCSVFFPLWQWGPRGKTAERYLNFAYSAHLTERDNNRMLQILRSREWRELWGERREKIDGKLITKGFTPVHMGAQYISTSGTGWKLATSVGGVGTGERGSCVLLDDPHSIKDDTSEVVRPETVRWMKEAMMNRLNDMETSTIIAIMQRSHEADCAGEIIDTDMGFVHLNIPMEYELDQHCVTRLQEGPRAGEIFWEDPRKIEGECFWPERFPPKAVAEIKKLGDHVWVGQYQQRPEPRGGAIIKRDFWKHYKVPEVGIRKGRWPEFEYILGSLDSAFTEKSENDPSGFTIWGVFQDPEGSMCAMLLMAWRKHLTLGGKRLIRPKPKTMSWADYKADTGEYWGITHWMRYECTRFKANQLLIENKANGQDIYNELLKHAKFDPWAMTLIDPKNLDKIARANRVQPIFADGMVWARTDTPYAKTAIDEMAAFPRGRFRDITDSATQALWYLRKNGYLEHVDVFRAHDQRAKERAGKKPKGQSALYPV